MATEIIEQKQQLSLEDLALATLRDVCLDDAAPAAAKAGAARTILESIGKLKGTTADGASKRDLTTLSIADIDAEIKRFAGR